MLIDPETWVRDLVLLVLVAGIAIGGLALLLVWLVLPLLGPTATLVLVAVLLVVAAPIGSAWIRSRNR